MARNCKLSQPHIAATPKSPNCRCEQVPVARKLLEIFLFKMKALFNKFGCGEALQMGHLKLRNLKGESMDMEQEYGDMDQDENPSDVDEVILPRNFTGRSSTTRDRGPTNPR